MKTYIYTVKNSSSKRGFNRTITVYCLASNYPVFVGTDDEISTASYKGDYATACGIIGEFDKLEMTDCGYYLKDKSIKVVELY